MQRAQYLSHGGGLGGGAKFYSQGTSGVEEVGGWDSSEVTSESKSGPDTIPKEETVRKQVL